MSLGIRKEVQAYSGKGKERVKNYNKIEDKKWQKEKDRKKNRVEAGKVVVMNHFIQKLKLLSRDI